MAAFFLVLITASLSDRVKARGPFMIGGCLLAIVGYIMLLVASKPLVRYGGTFFVASGVFVGSPMVSSLKFGAWPVTDTSRSWAGCQTIQLPTSCE